jgi:ABC-type branched-subunit amino acid transport system substrate-binding protein
MTTFKNGRRAAVASLATLAMGLSTLGVGTASATAKATPGVTATSVTIGATVPLSGPADGYANVSAAANAVFQYVNAKGGVNGRKIDYIRLDDCYGLSIAGYCANSTLAQTTTLVTTDNVFATVGSLGTLAQLSVLSYMKLHGVPQLFENSGSSDWNQPVKYPQLFGFQASYKVESKIFAAYIEKNYKTATIGFLGQNDDFGLDGYAGLTTDTGVTVKDSLEYNWTDQPNALEISQEVTKMYGDGVNLLVLDSTPQITEGILQDIASVKGWHPTLIISSVGSNPLSVNDPLENNATSFDSLPATNDKTNTWNKWLRKVLTADHTDFLGFSASTPLDPNEQYGASFAVAFLEALYSLGNNVTRAGIEKAMTTTKFATPGVVPLSYSKTNHQGIQCGIISKVLSNGSASGENFTLPTHTVSCTTDSPTAAITTGKYTVAKIPAWMS